MDLKYITLQLSTLKKSTQVFLVVGGEKVHSLRLVGVGAKTQVKMKTLN